MKQHCINALTHTHSSCGGEGRFIFRNLAAGDKEEEPEHVVERGVGRVQRRHGGPRAPPLSRVGRQKPGKADQAPVLEARVDPRRGEPVAAARALKHARRPAPVAGASSGGANGRARVEVPLARAAGRRAAAAAVQVGEQRVRRPHASAAQVAAAVVVVVGREL